MKSLKDIGLNNVIDSHTHSGGTDYYNLFNGAFPHTQGVSDLLLKARLTGVEQIVTAPFPATSYYNSLVRVREQRKEPSGLQDYPYQIENHALLLSCNLTDGQMMPFLCVDPTTKAKEQLDALSKQWD